MPAAVSIDNEQHCGFHLADTTSAILTVHTPQTVYFSRCMTKGEILRIRDNDNRRCAETSSGVYVASTTGSWLLF